MNFYTSYKAADFDAMCDPEHPRVITVEDVTSAAFRIQSGIIRTPCVPSHMSAAFGMKVFLKCEFLQYTGSFKERGARNSLLLLTPEAQKKGVSAASLGNHSQGMSYHGQQLGIPTTAVMPKVAPITKIQKCINFGANVVVHGRDMTDAKQHAIKLARDQNLTYINGSGRDHPGNTFKDHTGEFGDVPKKAEVKKDYMDVHKFMINVSGAIEPIEFDPMCDKENPQKISFEDVSAASFRIKSGIIKTPCVKSHMSTEFGSDIFLKNDFLQHTGSFKERGARNALLLLSSEAKQRGVISASLGNHSQGLSYHANMLKIPTTVVMPNVAPIMKIQKCRSYGANVIIHGDDMKEAKYHAMTLAKERDLTYINGYDHPHIMAGQGTVGLEILEQVPEVDAVLVPVGGGGLLAGVATAIKHLKPQVLIYGVETEKCPSMKQAMKNEAPVSVDIRSTLADGLAVPTVGYNAFCTVKTLIDKMITVNEDWIARAILRLAEQEKYVVEGGGAVGVAVIMAGLVPELAGKKVVCILSGGNIDTTILGRCLERGLAAEQRLVKFKVTVSDRPGGIAELCKLIASIGVSIKDIMQERAWVHGDIFSVRVKVVCETRGPEHMDQLRTMIADTYKEWYFAREHDDYPRRRSINSLDEDNVSH